MLIGMNTSACPFSGCRYALRKMIFAFGGSAREIEALAPDQHQVGIVGERARAVVLLREQRARRGGVRILVRADQEIVLEALARLRHPVLLDERGEAAREAPAWNALQLLVGAPARHQRDAAARARRSGAGQPRSPQARSTRPALLHRLRRARPLEDLREVAPLVADPRPVDLRILERRHALDPRRSAAGRAR